MRVSIIASVLGLLAAFVAAQDTGNAFNIPSGGLNVEAGKSLDLSWGNQQGSSVTIKLQQSGSNITPGSGVTLANVPNTGSATVQIPGDVSKGYSYTIEIINNDKPDQSNFSNNFQINGATNTANPATASSTGTSSASSSSSGSSASSTDSSSSTTDSSSSTTDSSSSTTMSTTTTSSSSSSSSSSSDSSSSTDSSSSSTDSSSSSSPSSTSSDSSSSASASASAQSTTAPGAGAAIKAPAGLLVAVLGAAALL